MRGFIFARLSMSKKRQQTPTEPDTSGPIAVQLQVQYEFPESMAIGAFANHMLVQTDEHDFHLSFFQITPPMIVGSSDTERMQHVKGLTNVSARCVARVVVSDGMMPKIIEALQGNLDRKRQLNETRSANGKEKAHDKTA